MSITLLFALLIGVGLSAGATVEILGSGEGNSEICFDDGTVTKIAHDGWPYRIDCKDIAHNFRHRNSTLYKDYKKSNSQCILRYMNGTTFWNVTSNPSKMRQSATNYPVFEIQDIRYKMELQIPDADYCSEMEIHLQVDRIAENITCENLHEVMDVYSKKVEKGNAYKMGCTVDYNDTPGLFLQDVAEAEVTYEWWHNCSSNLPENTLQIGNELTISGSDFNNGGIYSCAVNYRGQKRFLARHQICIKYPNAGTSALKCPAKAEAKEGKDLNVTCNVDFGVGHFPFLFVEMTWFKVQNGTQQQICRANPYYGLTNSTYSENIQCLNAEFRTAAKCFQYLPPVEERQPEKHSFQFSLFISDLKGSDEGEYVLIFDVVGGDSRNSTIKISVNRDDVLMSNASIVAIAVSILLTLIILGILCIWRKMDLLWFFKKHFGPYEEDEKTYTAYLAYHFSTDTMDESSRNLMENLIDNLYEFMDNLGAKTYDDHRDGNELQMEVENISQRQKDCHRIIIILNKEYVTDHWNLHKAYLALRNMIEGGSQVIFISLPDVEQSYADIPDEPRTALKHAMKMNTTIKWSGNLPLSGSFRRHLEYALPKVRKSSTKKEPSPPEKIMMQSVA